MINVLLLILLRVRKNIQLFKSVIFNEELQGITGNVEAINDNKKALKFDWVC